MKISEIMTRNAQTVSPDQSMRDAAALMARIDSGALLVEENDQFLDAYDWLARTREAAGELAKARDILVRAAAVSPHRLGRLRRLGAIALEMDDPHTAEAVLREVVRPWYAAAAR